MWRRRMPIVFCSPGKVRLMSASSNWSTTLKSCPRRSSITSCITPTSGSTASSCCAPLRAEGDLQPPVNLPFVLRLHHAQRTDFAGVAHVRAAVGLRVEPGDLHDADGRQVGRYQVLRRAHQVVPLELLSADEADQDIAPL